jgi:glutamyl/glutaminyl-tRNA synthetase
LKIPIKYYCSSIVFSSFLLKLSSLLSRKNILKEWMTTHEIGMGKVMQPLRLSLVGALKGPHLFDIIEMIGKEETMKRIKKVIERI